MIKKKSVPFISENASVKNAIIQITKKTYGCVLVINKYKKVVGIITDGDIRRSIHKKYFLEKTAKEVMTKKPQMISEDTLAGSALDIMNKKKITSLIVRGKNNNYGLIHIHSLVSFGV
jgi:arabinose-5-phosphate isomerase